MGMKIFKTLDINPTNINLYYEAFTHTSYSNENPSFANYERLEFLGDAVLSLVISEYIIARKIICCILLNDSKLEISILHSSISYSSRSIFLILTPER